MTTLVTRPQPQADEWAQALSAQGVPARALPLIDITAPPRAQDVAELWATLPSHRTLMFVSPAAVDWFFRLRPPAIATWPEDTLAAAPGPGTARVLQALGGPLGLRPEHLVSPEADSPQFDSEALWPHLAGLDWQGQCIAIVSGGDAAGSRGRTWLSAQWRARGAEVHAVQAYQRTPGTWTPAQQALARQALARPEAHVWLFSSSQAIDHLAEAHLPALAATAHAPAPDWPRARALCTHPRIAERARALGFGEVRQCAPTLSAVVEARRSPP